MNYRPIFATATERRMTMTVLKHCPNCGAKMDESEDKNEIF